VIGETPQPSKWGVAACASTGRRLADVLKSIRPEMHQLRWRQVVERYTGAKRRRYEEALNSLTGTLSEVPLTNSTQQNDRDFGLSTDLSMGPKIQGRTDALVDLSTGLGVGPKAQGRIDNTAVGSRVAGIPINRDDAKVSAFVKAEKVSLDDPSDFSDPRIIQCRSPRYNIPLASFLKPVEETLYALKRMPGQRGGANRRLIAKGLDQTERGKTILDKWRSFKDPVCISLDASRFDKHVSKEILEVEHSVYLRLYGNDPLLRKLLSWQLHNKGQTMVGGVKYFTKGRRMSGDPNTALGNCTVTLITTATALRALDISNYDLFDDGDDCLLFMEACDWNRIRVWNGARDTTAALIKRVFLEFGFKLKIENVAYHWEDIVFCQSKVVLVSGDAPRFIRDYRKVLRQSACSHRHWPSRGNAAMWLAAVGMGDLVLHRGIPILQEYARYLLRCSRELNTKRVGILEKSRGPALSRAWLEANRDVTYRYELEGDTLAQRLITADTRLWESEHTDPINLETRLSFERVWGVSISDQMEVEREIGSRSGKEWNDVGTKSSDMLRKLAPQLVYSELGDEWLPGDRNETFMCDVRGPESFSVPILHDDSIVVKEHRKVKGLQRGGVDLY